MIETGITKSAKLLFLKAILNDTCKIALYGKDAELDCDTQFYTPKGEVSGQGYQPGGMKLKNCDVHLEDDAACITWDNAVWQNATITAAGYMIYDTSKNNTAIFVGSWGSEYTSTNGPFVVNIPHKQIMFL